MGLLPIVTSHDGAAEKQLAAATGNDAAWSSLDGTPEQRYDVFVELGPQRANVASPILTSGPGGASEGGWGQWPQNPGWDNDPKVGFKPALIDFVDLRNLGVFEPPPFGGGVQMQDAYNWHDGGVASPLWQQPNNVSPTPPPWDAGLTLGYGPPMKVLPS